MVSALVSGSIGPGSSPGRGHCVVLLGKTLNSHCASLHPGVSLDFFVQAFDQLIWVQGGVCEI